MKKRIEACLVVLIGGAALCCMETLVLARETRRQPAEESPKPPESPRKALGGQVVKTGKLLVVRGIEGGEPQLTDEGGKRFLLTGSRRDQLLRLGGLGVKIWGEYGQRKVMMPTIIVERYMVTDAGGGKVPLVGVLQRGTADALVLRLGESVVPVSASTALTKRLRQRIGCKVWIVGELVTGVLKASRFGWIQCKADVPIKPKDGGFKR